MGLSLTAYKNLSVVKNPKLDGEGEPINRETEWKPGFRVELTERHFPGRAEGVDPNAVYSWKNSFEFSPGSYSAYNWWRDNLYFFASGNDFNELINFSDSEGVIGSVVSKKLARDFIKNESKAKVFSKTIEQGDGWFEHYLEWKKAFEMASDNGAVEFH